MTPRTAIPPRPLARVALALTLVACGSPGAAPSDAGTDAPATDAGPPPPPPSEPGRHTIEIVETRRIIPSEGIPADLPQRSNNNLDVARLGDRVYLAWRTAPDHFASPDAWIHVVSSTDEITWQLEASYNLATDLREPRFLVIGDRLFLYVSVLGTSHVDFTPMGVRVAERAPDGTWSATLEPVAGLEQHLAWRTRTEHGAHYMTAYLGGEMIYDFVEDPHIRIDLLTTTDGRTWSPVDPARRTIYEGGGSETDFTLADDGTLYGVIRLEAGDANGFGSRVCRAPATDITDWTCVTDPRKYDSPLMFWHDGEAYLVGRRNLTETGDYDLGEDGTLVRRLVLNQLAYSNARKRCAIWRWVQDEMRIAYVMDLPSRGDTCFPAMIPGARADELVVYDYSSDIEGPDVSWSTGQSGDTFIYRHVLRFTPR